MSIQTEIKNELHRLGAEFVYFVDITQLSKIQNKGYPNAVLFGITLSPEYLQKITCNPDYVLKMIQNNQICDDEFDQKEKKTDSMADSIASWLTQKGYSACSQSEKGLGSTGGYDEEAKRTALPHKTIAGLAGLGFIGKHDLLVTAQYGSALSMCTVLTNAPLKTDNQTPVQPQCGNCRICVDICSVRALKGNTWHINAARDELVDVDKCNTCLKCLVFCPWTRNYMNKNLKKHRTVD